MQPQPLHLPGGGAAGGGAGAAIDLTASQPAAATLTGPPGDSEAPASADVLPPGRCRGPESATAPDSPSDGMGTEVQPHAGSDSEAPGGGAPMASGEIAQGERRAQADVTSPARRVVTRASTRLARNGEAPPAGGAARAAAGQGASSHTNSGSAHDRFPGRANSDKVNAGILRSCTSMYYIYIYTILFSSAYLKHCSAANVQVVAGSVSCRMLTVTLTSNFRASHIYEGL